MAKAESRVESRELVKVAKLVAGTWMTVAVELSPELFTYGKINEIEEQHRKPVMQALAAFELWMNSYASKATCHEMVKALCEAHHREQAVEVFGYDLVQLVGLH